MAISRRQFIKRTGLATGTLLGSSLFSNPLLRRALADTIGDRYFIVMFLDGGNDGLNTVVPYDDVGGLRTAYNSARNSGPGGLRIDPSDLAVPLIKPMKDPNTHTQLGFHPGLAKIRDRYDLGQVVVVQGVGYPDYSLSHDESRTTWQTANPKSVPSFVGTGWMGRYLADNYTGTDIPGLCIDDSVAPEFTQFTTSVLATTRLSRLDFPLDDNYSPDDDPAKKNGFGDLCDAAKGSIMNPQLQPTLQFIGNTGNATLDATVNYPTVSTNYNIARPTFLSQYNALGTETAKQFREVAKTIYDVNKSNLMPPQNLVSARFFEVRNGGYDTHSDQSGADPNGQHYQLHQEVAEAIDVFLTDMADLGTLDKVCILIWSEFARRIEQNDSGTDHGSQGPVLVIGGPAVLAQNPANSGAYGWVYGNHPEIGNTDDNGNTAYSQNNGNGFRSTDIRDVYGTILKHWLSMGSGQILSDVLPVDGGDPNLYWTTPNLDMGFIA